MNHELALRVVLLAPPPGVTFGIQKGRGSAFETVSAQQATDGGDLTFDFALTVKDTRADGQPDFGGPIAQGPAGGRFVYVGVGTFAGQTGSPWSRRIKVPLEGIPWTQIRKVLKTPGLRLCARVRGRGMDGSPSCATVPVLGGWEAAPSSRNA